MVCDTMTPLQEILNAFTELLWVVAVLVQIYVRIPNNGACVRLSVMGVALAIHAPCSINLHIRKAMRPADTHDNFEGRLDQSSILVVSIAYMYVLFGWTPYSLVSTSVLASLLPRFWTRSSTGNDRAVYIAIAAIANVMPLVIEHGARTTTMVGWLAVGGALFSQNRVLHGYGHALFHLTMFPYHMELLRYLARAGALSDALGAERKKKDQVSGGLHTSGTALHVVVHAGVASQGGGACKGGPEVASGTTPRAPLWFG